jgi:hypothetical protein
VNLLGSRFRFGLTTGSSPNWAFALGFECWQQSRTLSLSPNALLASIVKTFPGLLLSFEPTPFGIHVSIQAALNQLRSGASAPSRASPYPSQTPVGSPPEKRSRFSPTSPLLPVGGSIRGLRRAVEVGADHASRAHLRPRTSEPSSLPSRIALILEGGPALQEVLTSLTHERVQFLFDLACLSSSPIGTIWEHLQGFE